MHGRCPCNKNKPCQLCDAYTYTIVTKKLHTREELVVMESSIVEFRQDFYINAIQKLVFHIPHLRILGMHHCGNT